MTPSMGSYKNILFPFDAQIPSKKRFTYVIDMVKKHQGKLILLYAIRLESSSSSLTAGELKERLESSTNSILEGIQKKIRSGKSCRL